MLKIKRMKKAFTLIELLVVVAIIAILATIIIINVIGARAKAERSKVAADMDAAVKAAAACVSFDGVLTAAPAPGANVCGTTTGMDDTEIAAADATWPTIPTTWTAASYTRTINAGPPQSIAIAATAPNGGTISCSLTGCSTANGW